MPPIRAALIAVIAPLLLSAAILYDQFRAANSQLQNLPTSARLFNGRAATVRTDAPGSVTFDVTPVGTSSEGFWAFFTDPGEPAVTLGVGDKLTVSITFQGTGFPNTGQDIRWGVFDSLGTRNTANLGGGQNDATFIGDTGYGLQYFAGGQGSPMVLGRRALLTGANPFNNFGDFSVIPGTGATARVPFSDNTPYTLVYVIERLTPSATRITATLAGLTWTGTETTATPANTFDYFAFRIAGASFCRTLTFTRMLVEYAPAPPVITAHPQPTALTVQTGSNVTLAVGAAGAQLAYEWRRDDQPVSGNASAATSTLVLKGVQRTDAGRYTAVVSNAGGSATSNPVTLTISDTPVPPPPSITRQPANTTVELNTSGALRVEASGTGLVYQWFRNSQPLTGATLSELVFPSAQLSDTATYNVVVSNSSGSTTSDPAALTVVSAMRAISMLPAGEGVCTDTPITITFDQAPRVGRSGRIRIYSALDGALVDTIDLATSPQVRLLNGSPYNYLPVILSGNSALITPKTPLPQGGTFFITLETGVLLDAAGAPFTGWSVDNVLRFSTRSSSPRPGATNLTVAADGSGDFCTLQSALDFVPANNRELVSIRVKPGVYNEMNYVPSSKAFIRVRGEDRATTIIQYPDNANLNPGLQRSMFGVDAPDFTLEDITLWNTTPRGGSQAEAFRGNNQRITLNRVTLRSFQDTLWMQGLGFVNDSLIEGDVDFLWGGGTVYVRDSEIRAVTSGGVITQIRNGQDQPGYVFSNCRLTAAPGVTNVTLARIDPTPTGWPWSQVVYLNTVMGPHIAPSGWTLNNATAAPNVRFWEFNSTTPEGLPLDVSGRAPFSRQLSPTEAAQWSDPLFVLGNWLPYTVGSKPNEAMNEAKNEAKVTWTAPSGHSLKDWIGLFLVDAPDTSYLIYQYVGAPPIGSATFALPTQPGAYEFRYYLNDGFTLAATGPSFEIK